MMIRKAWVAAAMVCATLISSQSASAQAVQPGAPLAGEEPVRYTGPGKHSVNLSPLGLLFGSYNINYEYLHNGTHGVLAEAGFAYSRNDDVTTSSLGGSAGYRWHWRGEQNSGFLGANVGYASGSGSATIDGDDFELDVSRFFVVGNIGKRWAWDFGLNLTFRIGAGYGSWDVSTNSSDPGAREAVQDVQDFLELIPIALDGELSLGWVF